MDTFFLLNIIYFIINTKSNLKTLKKKGKIMFEYTEAGPKIHDAMYHCHADIMKHQPPISQPHTKRPYGETWYKYYEIHPL